jgi:hypothetical protein
VHNAFSGAGLTSPVAGRFDDDTVGKLHDQGDKLASWLQDCQEDILWPTPTRPYSREGGFAHGQHPVQGLMGSGIKDACLGRSDYLHGRDRPRDPDTFSDTVRKYVPRVLLAALLVAIAIFIHDLIFAQSDAAPGALRVTLRGVAITALVTPGGAITNASASVSGAFSTPRN